MLNLCIFFVSRWKQHEAYVQVLEAKYADLNCKSALEMNAPYNIWCSCLMHV